MITMIMITVNIKKYVFVLSALVLMIGVVRVVSGLVVNSDVSDVFVVIMGV